MRLLKGNNYPDFHSPWVHRTDGRTYQVKNLGWLLRHAAEVDYIGVREERGRPWDVTMDVYLRDGTAFYATWQDREVCRDWLKRPRFRGRTLWWLGCETTC